MNMKRLIILLLLASSAVWGQVVNINGSPNIPAGQSYKIDGVNINIIGISSCPGDSGTDTYHCIPTVKPVAYTDPSARILWFIPDVANTGASCVAVEGVSGPLACLPVYDGDDTVATTTNQFKPNIPKFLSFCGPCNSGNGAWIGNFASAPPSGAFSTLTGAARDNSSLAAELVAHDAKQDAMGTTNAGGVCKKTSNNINCPPTYDREPCAFTNPVQAHSGYCGWHVGSNAITITRVWCFTRGATSTATIQIDEETEAGIESAGTDVMTAQLVCDTNGQATTTFTNAGIAANSMINLDIDAVANAPTGLMVWIEYAFQ